MADEWRVDQAEFQGFVRAKLEENSESHRAIFDKLDSQEQRLRDAEQSVGILKVKAGLIGGIAAGVIEISRWIAAKFTNGN